jgi:hypothetical protein
MVEPLRLRKIQLLIVCPCNVKRKYVLLLLELKISSMSRCLKTCSLFGLRVGIICFFWLRTYGQPKAGFDGVAGRGLLRG